MAKKKIPKNLLMVVVGVLFLMSVMPGEGTKASDQQSIVVTEYGCNVDSDCPKCVGGGLSDYNSSDPTYLGELSYASCQNNVCELSDACLIWDCGNVEECSSIKQTILDNTLNKVNQNPAILFIIIGLIVAYFML